MSFEAKGSIAFVIWRYQRIGVVHTGQMNGVPVKKTYGLTITGAHKLQLNNIFIGVVLKPTVIENE